MEKEIARNQCIPWITIGTDMGVCDSKIQIFIDFLNHSSMANLYVSIFF